MADQSVGGRGAVHLMLRLLANSRLKSPKLALGEGNQERFENDNGFSKAVIQVVVVRVNICPHFQGIQGGAFGEAIRGTPKVVAEIHDDFLQGADIMKKLKADGEKRSMDEC